MTGESMAQAQVLADMQRRADRQQHLSGPDIEASYEMQIRALTTPPRSGKSPD